MWSEDEKIFLQSKIFKKHFLKLRTKNLLLDYWILDWRHNTYLENHVWSGILKGISLRT